MVAGDGFEPPCTGYEPAELPLLHPAVLSEIEKNILKKQFRTVENDYRKEAFMILPSQKKSIKSLSNYYYT